MQPHNTFNDEGKLLAHVYPANPTAVAVVMNAKEGDLDGRSEWAWVRLANGDLFLGVFPHGDTYIEVSDTDGQIPEALSLY